MSLEGEKRFKMNAMLYKMLEGQSIEGKYYLKKMLGSGGFGAVFRADEVLRDRVLREVAVKVIAPLDDAKQQEQQLQELIAAVNLNYPNLLRCFSAGEFELMNVQWLYLVMELAEYTLEQRLEKEVLSEKEVRQTIKEIALGLNYLHQEQKQVHRDLKPANVLWTRKIWALSDFGSVRRLGNESYTQTANPIGTIGYMPPEAFDGEISTAWDMWSLGILIIVMLNKGSLPYEFSGQTKLMKQVMNAQLKMPSLPKEWEGIVLGCLEKERRKRWTAEQVLSALESKADAKGSRTYPTPSVASSNQRESSGRLQTFIFETVTVDARGNINQRQRGEAQREVIDLGKGIKLEMVAIPGGSFMMGAPRTEEKSNDDERPQHRVEIAPFYMGKYPVTQAQYQAIMGKNPSKFSGANNPVERVNWNKAKEFCKRLSEKTGREYRLPSEAEWEYACRAGTTTPFYFGETITTDLANYDGNYTYGNGKKGVYRRETTPVGSFPPNAFGLYDMHGNLLEWCEDVWHGNYQGAPDDGSAWVAGGNHNRRVLRGSSWSDVPRFCRCAVRSGPDPDRGRYDLGFRVVSSVARTL